MNCQSVEISRCRTAWVLGSNVSNSLSPALHNAAYKDMNIPWSYASCSLPLARLEDTLRSWYRNGAVGGNLTVPFKEATYRYLSRQRDGDLILELDEHSHRLGSVNTVMVTSQGLRGHSTDGPGWWHSFSERFGIKTLADRHLVLIGAGGAARAIFAVCQEHGISKIDVINRHPERGQNLVSTLEHSGCQCRYAGWRWNKCLEPGSIVVQATSRERNSSFEDLIAYESLTPGVLVSDLRYGKENAFLEAVQARGADVQDGIDMLIHQAALAIEIWTGRFPSLEAMRNAVK